MTVTASVEDVRAPGPNSGTFQPYIRLPEKLPAGMYLIQTTYQGKTLQAWVQVTDVSSYVALSDTKTVVWSNDVATGGPLVGAKVELAGASGTLGTTGADGTAQFDTPKGAYETKQSSFDSSGAQRSAKGAFIVTDAQGRFAVVPLSPNATRTYTGVTSDYQAGSSRDYWHFVAADRPIYQPTDKINVFGVIRAREGEIKREFTLDLNVSSGEGRRVGITDEGYDGRLRRLPGHRAAGGRRLGLLRRHRQGQRGPADRQRLRAGQPVREARLPHRSAHVEAGADRRRRGGPRD